MRGGGGDEGEGDEENGEGGADAGGDEGQQGGEQVVLHDQPGAPREEEDKSIDDESDDTVLYGGDPNIMAMCHDGRLFTVEKMALMDKERGNGMTYFCEALAAGALSQVQRLSMEGCG